MGAGFEAVATGVEGVSEVLEEGPAGGRIGTTPHLIISLSRVLRKSTSMSKLPIRRNSVGLF